MSKLQEGCKEILQPAAGCIIILALKINSFTGLRCKHTTNDRKAVLLTCCTVYA